MKLNLKKLGALALMFLLSISLALAVGIDTHVEDCCYASATDTVGYFNTSTSLCYFNSSQTVDGYLSTSAFCQNDMRGLEGMGSDLGSFLTNLAPGVGSFIIILGVFGAIAGIVWAIVMVIKKKMGRDQK